MTEDSKAPPACWLRPVEEITIIEAVSQTAQRALDEPGYLGQLGLCVEPGGNRDEQVMRAVAAWIVRGRYDYLVVDIFGHGPQFLLLGPK